MVFFSFFGILKERSLYPYTPNRYAFFLFRVYRGLNGTLALACTVGGVGVVLALHSVPPAVRDKVADEKG